ncbi:type VI secretion system-associated FHA domain protein TagH [Photobacterium alginatilyticum]|uniref:Type VI secretion system-associated FHA domain protein TagH n=1 Tax=Photobacterium alginatilyticum TaxID=1775171 RepID=A0ABW9YTN6_9GAMM|nr:type VI secretion system-associated FHA domain protein TagH [Photobacterium alginatilyticum]NBI55954.1 type VI secretion system-associated FHA domain protein TagH [Photobacterium alginatilyticum]
MASDAVMELTLSIVSYHRFTSELEAKKTFVFNRECEKYMIGRSQHCDWCLPDPERVISGKHANIEMKGDKLVIADISTNGVYINRSIKPLGNGEYAVLSDGDCISFGDYEIEVSLGGSGKALTTANVYSEQAPVLENESFAIPANCLTNTDHVEDKYTQPSIARSTLSVFTSQVEDNFMVPSSSNISPGLDQQELPIPEDWSLDLTQAPLEQLLDVEVSQGVELKSENTSGKETSTQGQFFSKVDNELDDNPGSLSAFVRGLGISPNMLPAEQDEQWWYELGVSMQCLMTGLMDSLHQRAAFKQTSRLNQTHFKRQENNPLKFSATFDDAIHNLFNRRSASFLPPEQAIKEAFSDIGNHEKALLAGVKGAVEGIIKTLSPESIESARTEHDFWNRFNPNRTKVNRWNTYESLYRRVEEDLETSSGIYCWDDFVKAYESSLRQG